MQINSPEWRDLVRHQADQAGIRIAPPALEQIVGFVLELLAWNQKINLTAITDPEEIAEKHIIDALIPAKFIPHNARILDLGTGGGFPGIVLKISRPSLAVSLVDSVRKKINFLKFVISMLKLQEISAHQLRAEELASHPEFFGRFDVVISRAFASLEKFLALAIPLIKPDGTIIAMKGRDVDAEIAAIAEDRPSVKLVGSRKLVFQVEKYRLPHSGDERALVMARLLI